MWPSRRPQGTTKEIEMDFRKRESNEDHLEPEEDVVLLCLQCCVKKCGTSCYSLSRLWKGGGFDCLLWPVSKSCMSN